MPWTSKALPPSPPSMKVDKFPAKEIDVGYELTNIKSLDVPDFGNKQTSTPASTTSLLEVQGRNHDGRSSWRYYQGWRMSVFVCAATAGSVLTINVILTLWASLKYGLEDGIATIQEGECRKTQDLSLWLHLAINVLSTVLLSASNYCMQCLASPTREELDRAHGRRMWLDIGVPSVRNLRGISWYKICLWWSLALSGIPLHLLYNSAVFSTLAAVEYTVYAGSNDLVAGVNVNWSSPILGSDLTSGVTLQQFRNASSWQKLSNVECISAYGRAFVSAHGDLLAVSPDLNSSEPALYIGGGSDNLNGDQGIPYDWICETVSPNNANECSLGNITKNAASWTLPNVTFVSEAHARLDYDVVAPKIAVDHCLSVPVEERCRLQFSLVIMIVVIFCNFVKATCMLLTLVYHKSQPLVTLGDAIASFLQHRDSTTENMCLANRNTFVEDQWEYKGDPLETKRHKWFSGASKRRWYICNVLCIITLIIAASLLSVGANASQLTSHTISHFWALGYGTVTSEQMIGWAASSSGSGLMLTILVANSPQAILSFLFLTYNGLFTCMLEAEEWSGYAHKRKALRVTSPVGEQRSTYRLQLPYRYGIPLLVLSGTLHWLVSQSLFLARVTAFTSDGTEDIQGSISTIGYSCIAIITVIILGAVVIIIGIVNGFRRYRPGMPLVGSCSAAISAACHRPDGDVDAATKGVVWGPVGEADRQGSKHYCFTSWEIEGPAEGVKGAGEEIQEKGFKEMWMTPGFVMLKRLMLAMVLVFST